MLRALFRQVQLLPQLLTVTPHLGLQLLLGLQVKLFTPLCRLQLFQGVAPRCVESRLLVLLVRVPATVADIVFGAVVIASVVIAPCAADQVALRGLLHRKTTPADSPTTHLLQLPVALGAPGSGRQRNGWCAPCFCPP